MNWYKFARTIYAEEQKAYFVNNGKYRNPVVALQGAFRIKDDLKIILDGKGYSVRGFHYWDVIEPDKRGSPLFGKKLWCLDMPIYLKEKNFIDDRLRRLGFPQIGNPVYENQISKPQQSIPMQNAPPMQTQKKIEWMLAKTLQQLDSLMAGVPVAIREKDKNIWICHDKSGKEIEIEASKRHDLFEPILINDDFVMSENIDELFNKYDENFEKPKEEKKEIKPNPYREAILNTFKTSEQNIMINALAGTGKAQPLDSQLLTIDGWKRMGEISLKDKVFGSDGKAHKILGIFPQGMKEIFEITFNDGSTVECSKDHLWMTETKQNRDLCRYHKKPLFSRSKISTAEDLSKDIFYKNYPKHYIPLVSPIEFNKKETKIDPYMIGVLLGDGCFRTGVVTYSSKENEIIEYINGHLPEKLTSRYKGRGYDYAISSGICGRRNEIVKYIKELGLWEKTSETKFIPDIYKFNDVATRTSVLQGLLDTDGHTSKYSLEYYTVSPKLAEDVKYMVESLGGVVTIKCKYPTYVYKNKKMNGKLCYRLTLKLPNFIIPFKLSRKLNNYKPKTKYCPIRTIVSIKNVGLKECQCISINSIDNLYVTNNFILTHNTTALRSLANLAKPGEKWLYLVFNKKNQVEAKNGKGPGGEGRFPATIEVATSHSFLGQVLQTSSESNLIEKTDLWQEKGERLSAILDDKMEHDNIFPFQVRFSAKKVIKKLVSLAKAYAIDPNSDKAYSEVEEIINKYQIDTDLSTNKNVVGQNQFTKQLIEKTLDILYYSLPGKSKNTSYAGFRDHDDTLWYAAITSGVRWPKYDIVLADEVQDFNKCQSIMLKKLAESGAKIVAVGDPNQAIYMFRGADSNAFENVKQIVSSAERTASSHALPINFRSGKKIIEYVNSHTHVKDLQADASFDGSVTEGKPYDDAMSELIKEWTENKKLKDQTAFISRTNQSLVTSALKLLRNNIDFQIIGRDFSKELIEIIERVVGKGRYANHLSLNINYPRNFLNSLAIYIGDLETKWAGKVSKSDELQELREQEESIMSIISFLSETNYEDKNLGMKVDTTEDFMEYLKRKFSGVNIDTVAGAQEYASKDQKSFVTLTSAHRSKGLEFGRVFLLDRDNFPHPRAKTPEEIGQENNAFYVALTRAKRELHVLQPMPKVH